MVSPLLLCLCIPPSHLPQYLQAACLVEAGLWFITAIQLRLIVIAADGLEPGLSLYTGRLKHSSLSLSFSFSALFLSHKSHFSPGVLICNSLCNFLKKASSHCGPFKFIQDLCHLKNSGTSRVDITSQLMLACSRPPCLS